MFSGIVECTTSLRSFSEGQGSFKLVFERPPAFDDLRVGDSIAVNGVCLTLEKFDEVSVQFSVGHETLRVLQFHPQEWLHQRHNFERSLKLSDRIHGHIVTGHVENLGRVMRSAAEGDNWFLDVEIPQQLISYVWEKGSITLHGVSLTVNQIQDRRVSVCLIPETQKRTNLIDLKVGDSLHLEADYLAKAFHHFYQLQKGNNHGH